MFKWLFNVRLGNAMPFKTNENVMLIRRYKIIQN